MKNHKITQKQAKVNHKNRTSQSQPGPRKFNKPNSTKFKESREQLNRNEKK